MPQIYRIISICLLIQLSLTGSAGWALHALLPHQCGDHTHLLGPGAVSLAQANANRDGENQCGSHCYQELGHQEPGCESNTETIDFIVEDIEQERPSAADGYCSICHYLQQLSISAQKAESHQDESSATLVACQTPSEYGVWLIRKSSRAPPALVC